MGGTMNNIICGDSVEVLKTLEPDSVQCVVTSPPYYGLRDYGVDGQIGLEETPEDYVDKLVQVFREVRRVLADDGTLWLNLGDSIYSGNGQPKGSDPRSPSRNWMRTRLRPLDASGLNYPKKSLLGIPWRVALALQSDGWVIRSEIIWVRDSAFPEPSVKDRPYRQHETIFLVSKSRWYYFDRSALPEEDVWHIPHQRGLVGHSAAFPEELPKRCILAGSREGDIVLDPFNGSGTTGAVAIKYGRGYVGIELNPAYIELTNKRFSKVQPALFTQVQS
jgi:DNA modification methylase